MEQSAGPIRARVPLGAKLMQPAGNYATSSSVFRLSDLHVSF